MSHVLKMLEPTGEALSSVGKSTGDHLQNALSILEELGQGQGTLMKESELQNLGYVSPGSKSSIRLSGGEECRIPEISHRRIFMNSVHPKDMSPENSNHLFSKDEDCQLSFKVSSSWNPTKELKTLEDIIAKIKVPGPETKFCQVQEFNEINTDEEKSVQESSENDSKATFTLRNPEEILEGAPAVTISYESLGKSHFEDLEESEERLTLARGLSKEITITKLESEISPSCTPPAVEHEVSCSPFGRLSPSRIQQNSLQPFSTQHFLKRQSSCVKIWSPHCNAISPLARCGSQESNFTLRDATELMSDLDLEPHENTTHCLSSQSLHAPKERLGAGSATQRSPGMFKRGPHHESDSQVGQCFPGVLRHSRSQHTPLGNAHHQKHVHFDSRTEKDLHRPNDVVHERPYSLLGIHDSMEFRALLTSLELQSKIEKVAQENERLKQAAAEKELLEEQNRNLLLRQQHFLNLIQQQEKVIFHKLHTNQGPGEAYIHGTSYQPENPIESQDESLEHRDSHDKRSAAPASPHVVPDPDDHEIPAKEASVVSASDQKLCQDEECKISTVGLCLTEEKPNVPFTPKILDPSEDDVKVVYKKFSCWNSTVSSAQMSVENFSQHDLTPVEPEPVSTVAQLSSDQLSNETPPIGKKTASVELLPITHLESISELDHGTQALKPLYEPTDEKHHSPIPDVLSESRKNCNGSNDFECDIYPEKPMSTLATSFTSAQNVPSELKFDRGDNFSTTKLLNSQNVASVIIIARNINRIKRRRSNKAGSNSADGRTKAGACSELKASSDAQKSQNLFTIKGSKTTNVLLLDPSGSVLKLKTHDIRLSVI